jgi:uracil-DNA glycosylase
VATALDRLAAQIRTCRICVDHPVGAPLAHAPRPVLRVSRNASGERLRAWMGVTADEFYDVRRVAILPMGFCYPGQDAHGGDLPPRRECAPRWRPRLFERLPRIELMLLVGGYAQRWHLKENARGGITATVEDWRAILEGTDRPRCLPPPHPSWRNNAWLNARP